VQCAGCAWTAWCLLCLVPGFVCATSYVCNVHFAQCSVCSARHMHKAHHAQANPYTCNSQEGMRGNVLVAVCFWALFALCTSYVVYPDQCAMCGQQARCAMLIAQMSCDSLYSMCFSDQFACAQALHRTHAVCNVRA